MKLANWYDLHDWGVLDKINNEILHPLGLKLIVNNGNSPGCLIANDLYFPNSDEKEAKRKYENFLRSRYYYLKDYPNVRDFRQKVAEEKIQELDYDMNLIK